MTKIRVRYAPSPTGFLHIGNARTALFNYLFAKRYNGDFIVRIEDTDILRNVLNSEISQLNNLKWLGIDWQEGPDIGGKLGPYRQSERISIYQKYANQLLNQGIAYKEYKLNSQHYSLRFKVPKNKIYSFSDVIRGNVVFDSKEIEDWVIIKENGWPTYNFAVVIDDFLMKISHVLRGEEHITNTPKQLMIYESFGWNIPKFAHMTLILNENKKKLSKRDVNTIQFIEDYINLGYFSSSLFNFLSLLGFSPKSSQEILSPSEIINLFDETKITKSPAIFDKVKLNYINSQYIKKLSIADFTILLFKHFEKKGLLLDYSFVEKMAILFKDRIHYMEEILLLYKTYFQTDRKLNLETEKFLRNVNVLPILLNLNEFFKKIDFKYYIIEETINKVLNIHHIKTKSFLKVIRAATTLEIKGPNLFLFLELLSSKRVLNNLDIVIKKLSA